VETKSLAHGNLTASSSTLQEKGSRRYAVRLDLGEEKFVNNVVSKFCEKRNAVSKRLIWVEESDTSV
jgi:hypothetical protein